MSGWDMRLDEVAQARRLCEAEGHLVEVVTLSGGELTRPTPLLLMCIRGCGHLGWQLVARDHDLAQGECASAGHDVQVHLEGIDPRAASCARCDTPGWLVNGIICASHLSVPHDPRMLAHG